MATQTASGVKVGRRVLRVAHDYCVWWPGCGPPKAMGATCMITLQQHAEAIGVLLASRQGDAVIVSPTTCGTYPCLKAYETFVAARLSAADE